MEAMQKSTIAYILAALMLSTAVIYFVAAVEESTESEEGEESEQAALNGNEQDDDEDEGAVSEEDNGLATQVQTAFFAAVGIGYTAVGGWIVKDKGRTNAPYIIAVAGSISIIGLYVASRTVDLPIVGLQDDVGTIDILSKVLQVAITGVASYLINSNRSLRTVSRSSAERGK